MSELDYLSGISAASLLAVLRPQTTADVLRLLVQLVTVAAVQLAVAVALFLPAMPTVATVQVLLLMVVTALVALLPMAVVVVARRL